MQKSDNFLRRVEDGVMTIQWAAGQFESDNDNGRYSVNTCP